MSSTNTRWVHFVAWFFGAAFLTNAVPHFVNGVSGSPFQSPFASPPGEGLSSATINVVWALVNLVVAYLLLARVGELQLRRNSHALVIAVSVAMSSIFLAGTFGRFHGGAL